MPSIPAGIESLGDFTHGDRGVCKHRVEMTAFHGMLVMGHPGMMWMGRGLLDFSKQVPHLVVPTVLRRLL